jgi:hypothetical protein
VLTGPKSTADRMMIVGIASVVVITRWYCGSGKQPL